MSTPESKSFVQPLVCPETIRLAMLGMVAGNGHPYSWAPSSTAMTPGRWRNALSRAFVPT
jgi:hypothetical protein